LNAALEALLQPVLVWFSAFGGNQHSTFQTVSDRKCRYQGECWESFKGLGCFFFEKILRMGIYSPSFLVHDDHFAELLLEESIDPSFFQDGN